MPFRKLLLCVALIVCAAVSAAAQYSISGTVRGTGTASYPDAADVWVKLVSDGTVVNVTRPNAVTGAYTITGVASGSYSLVLSTDSSTGDSTPSSPLIWSFASPASGVLPVTVTNQPVTNRNFTLNYQCACNAGDGQLALKTIPMLTNGDLSDWGSVASDADNNSCDSAPDRDGNIQSTGRDLLQFSFTYDNSRIYGMTIRLASTSNTNNFIYYADTDADSRMESGEPVIVVAWQGSNRSVEVATGTYQAQNAAGDPLASPGTGYADGFTMPGQVNNIITRHSADWGSTSGTAMQWYVTWAELGLPGPRVIKWHISSTNSTPGSGSFPGQVDDNMGGCGGCVASTQYGALAISAAASAVGAPGSTAYLPHVITNQGNGPDKFDLTSTHSGPWVPTTVQYYSDSTSAGTVGLYDAGIDTLLTDTDADGVADTDTLAVGATLRVLVAVEIPAGASATGNITTTGSSSVEVSCGSSPPVSQSVTDTVQVGYPVAGFIYLDDDHDGTKAAAEAGTGQTLYAKLLPQGGSAFSSVVAVDTATGAYSFPAVVPGSYAVYIGTANTTTPLIAAFPSGYIGTQNSSGSAAITVASAAITGINFGLYGGSSIRGYAFSDTGSGGAVANNGSKDGGEAGLAGVPFTVTNAAGDVVYQSGTTDGAGDFRLYVPASAAGSTVVVRKGVLAGYLSTGGLAGTTAGTYDRAAQTVSFSFSSGQNYTGVAFGVVPENTLSNDNTATVTVGNSKYYAHTFVAGSAGSVTFSTSAVAAPAQSAYTETLYADTNCNGSFEAGEPLISGATAVAAGTSICVLVKETVAANATGQNTITVSAAFTYTNASPALSATVTRTDVTTSATSATVTVEKSVDKIVVFPGEVITYTVTYRNTGSFPATSITISDTVPAYTKFASAGCVMPLPASIAACNVTAQPAVGGTGAVVWTLTGSLAPAENGSLTLKVYVE